MNEVTLKKKILKKFEKPLKKIGAKDIKIEIGDPPSPTETALIKKIGDYGKYAIFTVWKPIKGVWILVSVLAVLDWASEKSEIYAPKHYKQAVEIVKSVTNVIEESVQKRLEPSSKQPGIFYIVFETEWLNDRNTFERFNDKYITSPREKTFPNHETPFNRPDTDRHFLPNSSYVTSSSVVTVGDTVTNSDWSAFLLPFDPKKKNS